MVHIVGCGPTGMSLAWELRKKDIPVTVYERKPSAGGSWWEPDLKRRDIHAHRIVFDRAWVNTKSLFHEMGMDWDTLFEKHQDQVFGYILKKFQFKDYLALLTLPFVASLDRTVKDVLHGRMSPDGEAIMEHLPLIIDGVTWDVMSSYELLASVNHVGLSGQWTQRVSGKIMCDQMYDALQKVGVKFKFNTSLDELIFLPEDDTYVAKFSDGTRLKDDLLVLCVDNSPAIRLMGKNWGDDAVQRVHDTTYGAINVLIDFREAPTLPDDLQVAVETRWKLQPRVLSDGKTVSCVICHLTEEILTTPPDVLKKEVLKQLNVTLPQESSVRIGWGATWDGARWQFSQSSGVFGGNVPFFGQCSRVALCGMMSDRSTPYASLEAAIEVGRRFASLYFGTSAPIESFKLSNLIFIIIVFIILLNSMR